MRLRILVVARLGLLVVPAAGGTAATGRTVVLRQCGQNPLVECGSIAVPLYRSHPGVGYGDRFVSGLAVSGRAVWNRTALRVRAALTLRGPAGMSGEITLGFPTNRPHGRAVVSGMLGGRHVHLRLSPPWTSEG
jgi:hypothetical protein